MRINETELEQIIKRPGYSVASSPLRREVSGSYSGHTVLLSCPQLPPRALGPNASRAIHWGTKTKIKRQWQAGFYVSGLAYRNLMWTKATMTIEVIVPDKRSIMDTDNMLAICKSAIDMLTGRERHGQVGLGIITDDSPDVLQIVLPVVWTVDKKRSPMTIFEVREL